VRHRRAVLGVGGGWLIVDWLEGHGEHAAARRFHLAPGVEPEPLGADAMRLWSPSRKIALLLRDLRGDALPVPGSPIALAPYSELYGRATLAPLVRMVERMALPALRVTLLVPERMDAVRIEDMAGDVATGALWIRLRDGRGCAVEVAVRVPDGPSRVGPLMTDALAVVMRARGAGTPSVVHRSGGSGATRHRDA
jgi:hypothetical protein